jgi:hypothetical protein
MAKGDSHCLISGAPHQIITDQLYDSAAFAKAIAISASILNRLTEKRRLRRAASPFGFRQTYVHLAPAHVYARNGSVSPLSMAAEIRSSQS